MSNAEQFERAIDQAGYGYDPERVVETAETVEHFIAARGKPQIEATEHGTLYMWLDVQQAKGLARGDLSVMDFGEFRFAHFTGEAR